MQNNLERKSDRLVQSASPHTALPPQRRRGSGTRAATRRSTCAAPAACTARGKEVRHSLRPRHRPQLTQRRCGAQADEGIGEQLHMGAPRNLPCQQHRLIVAPRPQAGGMQRHRHQQIGPRQHIRPGAHHHRGQRTRQVGAIGVFERQDQPLGLRIIAQRRPRLSPHRRCGRTTRANTVDRLIGIGQWHRAARTKRRADKTDLTETLHAELARCFDHLLTEQALRRQQHIEHRSAQRFYPFGTHPPYWNRQGLGTKPIPRHIGVNERHDLRPPRPPPPPQPRGPSC